MRSAECGVRNGRGGLEPRQWQVRAGVERPVAPLALLEVPPPGPRDHGGIVGVEPRARDRYARETRQPRGGERRERAAAGQDRKSTRLNSSHGYISYAVFCLKKKKKHRED